jgi:hypothetical protein
MSDWKFYLLLPLPLFWLSIFPSLAQTRGCSDHLAKNFDPSATQNDGSCQYPVTTYHLRLKASPLPEEIASTSGLAFDGNRLWTHNDSGHSPELFAIDTLSGQVRQRVTVRNASNIDWEDLAFDGTFLYVGDFGNNLGDRLDLTIYKIRLSAIGLAASAEVDAQKIEFSFPDQTDFSPALYNHSFDCEAFFYYQGFLHLFTKDWKTKHTTHYTMPVQEGKYVATRKESFEVKGLITGADITATGEVALIGYDNTLAAPTFMWLLYDFPENAFFSGNKRRIELGSATATGQIEGITFRAGKYGYISSELFTYAGLQLAPPRLYAFQAQQWLTSTITSLPDESGGNSQLTIGPNPFYEELLVGLPAAAALEKIRIEIRDGKGRLISTNQYRMTIETETIKITFPHPYPEPGLYFLTVFIGSKETKKSFKLMRLAKDQK